MKAELIFIEDFLQFPEGPRFDDEGNLYFGDALEKGFYRYSEKLGVEEIDATAAGVGGAVIHQDGGVVYSGRQGILHYHPSSMTINRVNAFLGLEPLVNVNDIEADTNGNIYGGTLDFASLDRGLTPRPGFLFRLGIDGKVTKLSEVGLANGLAFSPEDTTMYFSESGEGVFSYDLENSGAVAKRTKVVTLDDSDGLAIDKEGGIWVARYLNNHILHLDAYGNLIEAIETPFENVSSVVFGGYDMRELYITGGVLMEMGKGGVAKIRTDIPGLKPHKTSVSILNAN